jgi:hypothetical protein
MGSVETDGAGETTFCRIVKLSPRWEEIATGDSGDQEHSPCACPVGGSVTCAPATQGRRGRSVLQFRFSAFRGTSPGTLRPRKEVDSTPVGQAHRG